MDLFRLPLSRQIADDIRQRIRNGELLPGQKLNERELLEQGKVSRTPLREAISILAGERLVEASSSRGVVIKALTDEEIYEMVRVRGTLERLAGLHLAQDVTDDQVAEFAALCDEMDMMQARGKPAEWWEINRRFHRGLVRASGNKVLLEYWENVAVRMNVYNFLNFRGVTSGDRWSASAAEHREIVDLLARRDGPALGATLERHLTESWVVARKLAQGQATHHSTFNTLYREAMAAERKTSPPGNVTLTERA